jgi:hypothetical protein
MIGGEVSDVTRIRALVDLGLWWLGATAEGTFGGAAGLFRLIMCR